MAGKVEAKGAAEGAVSKALSSASPSPSPRDVSTRGARVRFVEAGAGTPLLLVHDAVATHRTFERVLRTFARSFRVVAPDLPGFGDSEKPAPERFAYGYDAFADALFDVVAALGAGRVHVLGHGMGGGVALTLAARYPAIVHKLVLVDALVFEGIEPGLERVARIPGVGGLVWRQLMGLPLFRSYLHGTVYAGAQAVPPARVAELYASFNAPAARQAAHATVVAKADTRTLVARLPRVNADALVVWGRHDRLAPVEHGRRLARELRGRFDVLECGRCPPEEMPEAFTSTVTAFLANQGPNQRAAAKPASSR